MTAAILPTDDLAELATRLALEVERSRLLPPVRAVYLSGADFASLLVADDLAEADRGRVVRCATCLAALGNRRDCAAMILA